MSRNLVCIGEHTIDASLLTPKGWVLDAGCRDFTFSRELARRGCRVVALDADPTVQDPNIDGVHFRNRAIAAVAGTFNFCMHENPEARFLVKPGESVPGRETVEVHAVTIRDLTDNTYCLNCRRGIVVWDVVKLDVEGAEYGILRTWPGPIARQISVEFHEHCQPQPQSVYDEIFAHLGQWYEVVQHEKTARHCTHPNYWDSLFVLKAQP